MQKRIPLTENILLDVEVLGGVRAVHGHGHALLLNLPLQSVDSGLVVFALLLELLIGHFFFPSELLFQHHETLSHLVLQINALFLQQLHLSKVPVNDLCLLWCFDRRFLGFDFAFLLLLAAFRLGLFRVLLTALTSCKIKALS